MYPSVEHTVKSSSHFIGNFETTSIIQISSDTSCDHTYFSELQILYLFIITTHYSIHHYLLLLPVLTIICQDRKKQQIQFSL